MKEPNYILKTEELYLVSDEAKWFTQFRKKSPLLYIGYTIWRWWRGGFVFGNMMLFILGLLITTFWSWFGGKKIRAAAPFELRFYDDYLVWHVPIRRYRDSKVVQETCSIKYSDITEFTYETGSKQFRVLGDMDRLFYKLDENNQIIKPAYRDDFFTDGIFTSFLADHVDIDFVGIVEAHSPIKVEVRDW